MRKGNVIVGIDIGSNTVKTVIAQDFQDMELPRIVGVGKSTSLGVRKGVIIDVEGAVKSINESVEQAERMAGIAVKNAIISIGGSEINFQNSKGVVAVGRADSEVTDDDIDRVIRETQTFMLPPNREIVHVIPRSYRLDDQENIKDPLGMKGVRLEADAMLIEVSSTHLRNLTKAVEQADIAIDDVVLNPLAASRSVLDSKQKELGVAMVNIGGATTSLAVFEEGELVYASILPVGADHITNDIAIGLRTSIDIAEKVKLEYGSSISHNIGKREEIDLSQIDSRDSGVVLRHHVVEIIEARLEEIFGMVERDLKKIGRSGLLPAGVVITGGGAKMPEIVELAKGLLRLPVQVGFPVNLGGIMDKVDDPSFATVIGLILWEKDKRESPVGHSEAPKVLDRISHKTGGLMKVVKKWLERFLP